jgi:hypothetical protein
VEIKECVEILKGEYTDEIEFDKAVNLAISILERIDEERIEKVLLDCFGKNQYERYSKVQTAKHLAQAIVRELKGE